MSTKNLKLDLVSCPYFFVYGTLKSGQCNNSLLTGATYVGAARTALQGVLTSWGAPAFCPEPWLPEDGSMDALMRPILGEVYLVTDHKILERLDRLEGHPCGYYRSQIWVEGDDHEDFAWCYFYDAQNAPLCHVVDGCYEWRPDNA